MLSTNDSRMTEATSLLEKESTSQLVRKKDYFAKKGCLVIFAVVCGLAIVFAVLMTKWHLISQSVIAPTVSQEEFLSSTNSNINDKHIDPDDSEVVDDAPPPPPPPPSSKRVKQDIQQEINSK